MNGGSTMSEPALTALARQSQFQDAINERNPIKEIWRTILLFDRCASSGMMLALRD
jgi:hypothetical protein